MKNKEDICGLLWIVTTIILVFVSVNSSGNIWADGNNAVISVFIINGISLVYGLYLYLIRKLKQWQT